MSCRSRPISSGHGRLSGPSRQARLDLLTERHCRSVREHRAVGALYDREAAPHRRQWAHRIEGALRERQALRGVRETVTGGPLETRVQLPGAGGGACLVFADGAGEPRLQ
jgi:hypothetical protein